MTITAKKCECQGANIGSVERILGLARVERMLTNESFLVFYSYW